MRTNQISRITSDFKMNSIKKQKTPGKGDRCEILNETAVKLLCPAE